MTLAVTTTKSDLARALTVAKVGASADKTLPILNALNIAVTDAGNLVVQGTDRYLAVRAHLAHDDFSYGDIVTEGRLIISLQHVGLIQKWLTIVDKYAPVEITHTADQGLSVSAHGAPTLAGVPIYDGQYPKLGKLFRSDENADTDDPDRTGIVGLAGRNVAKMGTIAGHFKGHAPTLLRPGTHGRKGDVRNNDLLFRISDGNRVLADGIIMGLGGPTDVPHYQHGL